MKKKYLSIVIPVFNEEENLKALYDEIVEVMGQIKQTYEIIFVDDGSQDNSFKILSDISRNDHNVKVIQLRRNFGQTPALSAGFDHAQGDIIVPMDADLQNDPKDIPHLLKKINEGYDVVSGWRKKRKDPLFSKKIPSYFANLLISWVTGVHIKDYGCTLKAYKRELLENLRLYGEMHRFIPAYTAWEGAKIAEVEVSHRPRIHGKTKYGISRTYKVILDLFTTKFLGAYSTKPIYVFGTIGLFLDFAGIVFGIYVIYQKYALGIFVHRNPLILLAIFLFILGVLFIMMGLLAELVIRTYHESQNKPIYFIREKINIED